MLWTRVRRDGSSLAGTCPLPGVAEGPTGEESSSKSKSLPPVLELDEEEPKIARVITSLCAAERKREKMHDKTKIAYFIFLEKE